ncbi:Immunoglobulin V-set domain [Trinorchestia longiramus]|nr:Immunoglobulin V-set domain [Trinorchestia longiramus]
MLFYVKLVIFSAIVLWLSAAQPVTAGPGPAPINYGSGKSWAEWTNTVEVELAAAELNVTTAEGHTAALPCRVLHLGDKRVSWIRDRDLAVLAVDRITVTTDSRFSVIHPEETGDWIMEIRGASPQDSGAYDCQVNTYPKKSTRVNLEVLSKQDADVFLQMPASDSIASGSHLGEKIHSYGPTVRRNSMNSQTTDVFSAKSISLRILGRGWAEVHVGKALGVTCEAEGNDLREVHLSSRSPESPLIEWTLDEVPVTLLFDKDKVEIHESWREGLVTSQLTLYDLAVDDSGSFACHAPHAATDSIPVTVLREGTASHHINIDKYARHKNFDSKFRQNLWPRSKHPQKDAGEPQHKPLGDQHVMPSKAPPCSSQKAVAISGAVMLFIMIVNCVIGIAMYCKTH